MTDLAQEGMVSAPDMTATPAELGLASSEAIMQPDGVAPADTQRVTAEAIPTVSPNVIAAASDAEPDPSDFRAGSTAASPQPEEGAVVGSPEPYEVAEYQVSHELTGAKPTESKFAEAETLTVEQAAKAFATAWEELQQMHSLSDPKAFNTKLEEVNKLMVEYNIKALSQDVAALPETDEPGEEAAVIEPVAEVAPEPVAEIDTNETPVAPPTNEVAGVRVPGQAVEPQPIVGRTGELEQTPPAPVAAETVTQQDAA